MNKFRNSDSGIIDSNNENNNSTNSSSTSNGSSTTSSSSGSFNSNKTQSQIDSESKYPSTFDVLMGLLDVGDSASSDGYIDSAGVIHYKDKYPPLSEPGYYSSTLNYTDVSDTKEILNKMSRIPKEQNEKALDYEESVHSDVKNTRTLIKEINIESNSPSYSLRIGDVVFQVPPEYISITDNSPTISNIAIRQVNSIKTKTGHSNKNIMVTLFLNGIEQINGFKNSSPFEYSYYTDGLLAMIAQFKCTPFLPVENEYINTSGIFTVALKSISINTVKGFPNCVEVAIMLQEFNAEAFIETPNIFFDEKIEWDLQRYYYQRYINQNLKPIENILDDKIELKILDLRSDLDLVSSSDLEIDVLNESNYTTVLDSSKDNFYVTNMEIGVSNIFALQQLQGYESPSMQYLGGNDTSVIITIESTNQSVLESISEMLSTTQSLSRNNDEYFGLGFIKINNTFSNMFNVDYFMINNITAETVPQFPGLSIIQVECVSYDIASKEILKGFRPFEGDKKGTLDDVISKKRTGMDKKIKQDNIIEKKLTTLNLYPDLYLPTYDDVNSAIEKINSFRESNKLKPISYSKMPNAYQDIQVNGPRGLYTGYVDPDFYFKYDITYDDLNDDILEVTENDSKTQSNKKSTKSLLKMYKTLITNKVFMESKEYIESKESLLSNIKIPIIQSKNPCKVIGRMFAIGENDEDFTEAWVKGNEQYKYVTSSNETNGDGSIINADGVGKLTNVTGNAVADLALSILGRSWYFWGAFGGEEITQEYYDKMNKAYPSMNNKPEQRAAIGKGWLAFDCSSLASWCLRKCGVKDEGFRATSSSFHTDWDKSVTRDQLQPGDILRRPGHIGIYIGNGETVEANSMTRGVNKCKLGSYTHYGRYNNVPTTSELMQRLGLNDSNNVTESNNVNNSNNSNNNNSESSSSDNNNSNNVNKSKNIDIVKNTNNKSVKNIIDNITILNNINNNRTTDLVFENIKINSNARRPVESIDGNDSYTNSSNNSSSNSSSTSSSDTDNDNSNFSSSITSSMIDAHLGGMIANKGSVFCSEGQKSNVNPALVASIAIHESDNGKSSFCKRLNNCCGIMTSSGGRKFNSIDECISYTTDLLNRKYISQGKKSIEDIGAMYSPVGAANDPNNLNQYWVGSVKRYYKQITGQDYDESMATNGGTIDGSVASSGSGNGELHLLYLGANNPPKRLPSEDYMLTFSDNLAKFDINNLGNPNYATSPYNTLKDEEIKIYSDEEDTMNGYKPYSENWNINRDGYSNSQEVTSESSVGSGEEVDAQFTAYYPYNDSMQGGYYDAMGNKLDPSKNTCAAPKDIPFLSKITVKGTGTNRDGQTYTVTDRGGAIKVVNGVYHIDLLMSSKTEAYSFGRRNGKAIIAKATDSNSSSSSSSRNVKVASYKNYDFNILQRASSKDNEEESESNNSSVWSYFDGKYIDIERTDELDEYVEYLNKAKDDNTTSTDDSNSATSDEDIETLYNRGLDIDEFTNIGTLRRQEKVAHKNPVRSMFVDSISYSHFGRMVRAFPTYLFLICDDGGSWLDGRKLWTNYYSYTPIVSIKIHQSDNSPIQTAYIELTNLSGNLNNKDKNHDTYDIKDDESYSKVIRWVYKKTGILLTEPRTTQDMVDIKNEILESINLKSGARIHTRIGYGSNPLNLPICFNGIITDVENSSEIVSLIAQSDGYELVSNIVHTKDDNTTNTIFKYGNEATNIIGGIMVERENKWINWISDVTADQVQSINKDRIDKGKVNLSDTGGLAEKSKYGIEHFGIHLGYDRDDASRREYDLLKNIYIAKYKPVRFINSVALFDGEKNISMFLANKTPWEIFKAVEQTVPEFVCHPIYHQFESRLFFGLPWYNTSYRYNNDDGEIREYFKSFAQFHVVTSLNSIISNRIKTSKRNLTTNAIAVYSLGGNSKKTPTVYSDRNIDNYLQKTGIIDTTVTQDYLGPDGLYQMFGLALGKNAAINTALSNILRSWKETYGGELIIIGDASIKPYDYIFLDDIQSKMSGLFTVRETVHSFTMETGFVTSITPGLIAHSNLNNSGAMNIIASLTNLGISMAACYKLRYLSIHNTMFIKPMVLISKMMKSIPELSNLIKNSSDIINIYKDAYNSFKTGDIINNLTNISNSYKNTINSADDLKNLTKYKNIKNLVNSVNNSSAFVSAGNLSSILHITNWTTGCIFFDILLQKVIDSFQYNHSVYLVPMFHKETPFVSGTRGHSDSLINGMGSASTDGVEIAETEEQENENTLVEIYKSLKEKFNGSSDDFSDLENLVNSLESQDNE